MLYPKKGMSLPASQNFLEDPLNSLSSLPLAHKQQWKITEMTGQNSVSTDFKNLNLLLLLISS